MTAAHVVLQDDHAGAAGRCRHCGTVLRWVLPMDLDVWLALVQAFIRRHRRCPPPETR